MGSERFAAVTKFVCLRLAHLGISIAQQLNLRYRKAPLDVNSYLNASMSL